MVAMQAFLNTKVSRERLIESVRAHQEADRIVQGRYWADGRGCSVGCWLHDFAPGHEGEHHRFESLFGIDRRLARLSDVIFEGLPITQAREFPLALAGAIGEGCDTARAVDRWILWLLAEEGSPLEQWHSDPCMVGVANLYRRRLAGDEPSQNEWDAARAAARDVARAAARAAASAAAGAAAWDAAWAAAWAAASAGDAAGAAAGAAMRDALFRVVSA